ncbi:hypothetical protein B0H15DRAFT_102857 [Mycena belliarum]|uniref:Uncharacterized protein n=1 Tax=Mycena belliarum TaxID=1033014 RepID=A0AAD6U9L5_9AGAR|nr:hypothetical protein B0H15DRAFT_102857 [Mycena belliae]
MPQPASFLRRWKKRSPAQTSPTQGAATSVEVRIPPRSSSSSPASPRPQFQRQPSDTPSENSTRLLRFFKASPAETDVSSLGSIDSMAQKVQMITPALQTVSSSPSLRPPPSLAAPPPASPSFFERPLPSVPPMRPPRPPSLNLDVIEPLYSVPFNSSLGQSPSSMRLPLPRPPITERSSRRKMPELDDVWEGFIKDAEGEIDDVTSTIPVRRRGVPTRGAPVQRCPARHPSRSTLYSDTRGSDSTPFLSFTPELTDGDSSNDELSLFPLPPPLPRRRPPPKVLILRPTPSIAPLPPSPSLSSTDSTPIATPTTPRSAGPSPHTWRKNTSPASILKKSGMSPPLCSPIPTEEPPGHHSAYSASPTRLRSAQSLPHLHPSFIMDTHNGHRNASSDTASIGNRRRVPSHTDVNVRPFLNLGPPRMLLWSGGTQFDYRVIGLDVLINQGHGFVHYIDIIISMYL